MPFLNVPQHVAIIMDGNARWARARALPVVAGHRAGIKALEATVKRGAELGIKYMTFFAFSSENWQREHNWVSELMGLLRWYLQHAIDSLIENNVKIKIIGDVNQFDADLRQMLKHIENLTKENTAITVNIALSYGGRDDIKRAVVKIAEKIALKEITIDDISESLISNNLDTSFCPDPDLFIRSSGELRISNFMLWQMAYSELVFNECLWPDFSGKHLDAAVEQYSKRNRRFGLDSNAA